LLPWLTRFMSETTDALALVVERAAVARSDAWTRLVGASEAAALDALASADEAAVDGLELRAHGVADGHRLVHARRTRPHTSRFLTLIDAFPFAIGVHRHQRFLYVNRAATSWLGYPEPEALVGQPITCILDVTEIEAVRARVGHMMQTGEALPERETRMRKKDGSIVIADLAAFQIPDEDGLPSYVVVARDITERKELEERLRHGQRMEAVGRLAGGIAHDFNNLLAVILSYAELIAQDRESVHLEHAAEIQRGAERAAALTQQLLMFSRGQTSEPELIKANDIVLGLQGFLRRSLGATVIITTQLQGNLPAIRASASQLEQVLVNLALNARDALPPQGGEVIIKTGERVVAAPEVLPGDAPPTGHEGLGAGHYVCLEVSDNGHGMPPEIVQRAFEPFFTTKAPGKGTGLGLSTVYGIVRQAGGTCELSSAAGFGTQIRIYWPASPERAEPAEPRRVTPTQTKKPSLGGRVFLVEDDEAVRTLVSRLLRTRGFEVVEACDPPTALATARTLAAAGQRPDLVLSDVVMPQMDGMELVKELHQIFPRLPVVFMSGFADDVVGQHELETEGYGFVAKPFSTADLVAKVIAGITQGRAARDPTA